MGDERENTPNSKEPPENSKAVEDKEEAGNKGHEGVPLKKRRLPGERSRSPLVKRKCVSDPALSRSFHKIMLDILAGKSGKEEVAPDATGEESAQEATATVVEEARNNVKEKGNDSGEA